MSHPKYFRELLFKRRICSKDTSNPPSLLLGCEKAWKVITSYFSDPRRNLVAADHAEKE